jgi:hypothetical protein
MDQAAQQIRPSGVDPKPEHSPGEIAAFKYRAFLSYSHRDAKWAKWLHKALEGYRIEKDLVGRETPYGPVPTTLRPIFRDRDDFFAGHSLTEQTLGALEASQFLVVLCSPYAAQSKYVNEEIRRFKALGRTDRVITVIVDGEPWDPQRECFPPAVRFKLAADGEFTGERDEPLAADARPRGEGKALTLSKVLAGLLGIGLDQIVRRAARARKRRIRLLFGAVSAGAILILGAIVGWWAALSVTSRLNSAEILNLQRDAADLCEHGADLAITQQVAEARRIAFASQCVETLMEGYEGRAQDAHWPLRVVSIFEANLAVLRKAEGEGKLTSEQADVLREAGIFVAQLERR